MTTTEALEVEVNLAGGQLAVIALLVVACIGLTALVTYVVDEIHHNRQDRDP